MSDTTDSKTHAAKAQAVRARDELADALDAIEDKLNVPKRVAALSERAGESFQHHRVPWLVGGGAAAAVVIGLVSWAIFSDD